MRYGVEFRISRKLLLPLLIICVSAPLVASGRWLPFGPGGTIQVSALRSDRSDSQLLYLASDHGIFVSRDGGGHWNQLNNGLRGYPVLALEQAISGTWVAGTTHGIFLLAPNANAWRPSDTVVNEQGTPKIIHVKGVTRRVMAHHPTRSALQAKVNDIEIAPNRWLAATSMGIFSSSDQGKIWSGGPVNGDKEFVSIRAQKELVAACTHSKLLVSIDGGTGWKLAALGSAQIRDVVISPDLRIFASTSEGIFRSADGGATWDRLKNGLPSGEMGSLTFDPASARLLAYSNGRIFESKDRGQNWRHIDDAGLGVQNISVTGGRLFALTTAGLLAGPDKLEEEARDSNRTQGNWFLRLVHKTE